MIGRCGAGMNPPALISALVSPSERNRERGNILVLHRLPGVTDRHAPAVADRDAQRDGAVPDYRGQHRAAHALDRAAEEFTQVNQVRSDVSQRTGAGTAPVAPAHRGVWIEAVVTPVVAAEMPDPAEGAPDDLLTDRVDGR